MNTDELQRILKLTQQGHGVGMTAKFWSQLENLLKQRDDALKLAEMMAAFAAQQMNIELRNKEKLKNARHPS